MVDLSKTLTDAEMFRIIMEDVRRINERLDENEKSHQEIRAAMAEIKIQHAGDRVKLGGIMAGISLFVAGTVTWIVAHLSK
jgi:hypothetical protein